MSTNLYSFPQFIEELPFLSPRHQTAGSSFTFETPNTLAGVKFSEPDTEIIYNPDTDTTVLIAYRFGAEIINRLTGKSLLVSQEHIGIVHKQFIHKIMIRPIIHFETDRVYLSKSERLRLEGFAAFLKGSPEIKITAEGYADSTGEEEKNQQLSQRRAENVKYYLVTRHGIDERRFTLLSYGSARPVDTNDTEEGRANNRRVNIYW